ncbi:MAG: hypothetical protein AB8B63_14025 [Granulosicoccus sp.]
MKYSRICAALLLSASSLVAAEPTVTGKVISWPDDGWYQVQVVTDSGISEVCAGKRFCEVEPGTYIVINHTTGQRFEGVVINADPAAEVLPIEDNTITWPDDGWYQVQSVTDNGITEVCAGTRFCEVPMARTLLSTTQLACDTKASLYIVNPANQKSPYPRA